MIITSSNMALTSQHTLIEQESRQESLKVWKDGQPVRERADGQAPQQGGAFALQIRQDQISISAQAQSLWASSSSAQGTRAAAGPRKTGLFELSDADKQKIALIEKMLEMLTGKKVKLRLLDSAACDRKQPAIDAGFLAGSSGTAQGGQSAAVRRFGWGMSYELHEQRFEQEKTSMQAAGVVRTADGREIEFALDVTMSRQFLSRLDVSLRAGDAPVDPLVINLSGPVGMLTDQKFSFDIDSDGTADQISFAAPGSGFLALDRNNDGQINDGGELFGPQSGDGFADLAGFDLDGNSWIDENDAVFDRLRIWMKDESGGDRLVALGQAGVGAIYLGNVSTEFAVKDAANDQQGQIRSSGLYLRENGAAGIIQQIDLAV